MKTAPDFWWKREFSLTGLLLAPIGRLYGLIAGRRMLNRPSAKSRLPVLCIGNFVVGGTGKTPFAIELAYRLQEDGFRPGFLLRGYGGTRKGPLVVDAAVHDAGEVGDEALLLARHGPTVTASDRPAGARLLEQQPVDVILMDDGFQNPSLHKDLSLVLVDCTVGFGNGRCLPAGPLRAPASKQILKADCLVLVGEGDAAEEAAHLAGRKGLPILHAHLLPQPRDELEGKKLFAFAGIGRPQKFFETLKDLGYDLKRTRAYPDHHAYSEADVKMLLTEAEEAGLTLVTTSKDMARLETAAGELFHWVAASALVLEVRMHIDDEDRLAGLIKEKLRRRKFEG